MGLVIHGGYTLYIFDNGFFDNQFLKEWIDSSHYPPQELTDLVTAKRAFDDNKSKNQNHIFSLESYEWERSHELPDLQRYLDKTFFERVISKSGETSYTILSNKLDTETGSCNLSFRISYDETPECFTKYNYMQNEDVVLFDRFEFDSWEANLIHNYSVFVLIRDVSTSNLTKLIISPSLIDIKLQIMAKYCTPEILSLFLNIPTIQTTSYFDSDEITDWAESDSYFGRTVFDLDEDPDLINFEMQTRGYIYKNTEWRNEFFVLSGWSETEKEKIDKNLHQLFPGESKCVGICHHWQMLIEKISSFRAVNPSNIFVFIHSLKLSGQYSKMIVFDKPNKFLEEIGVELTTLENIDDKLFLEQVAREGKTLKSRKLATVRLNDEKLSIDILQKLITSTPRKSYYRRLEDYLGILIDMISDEQLLLELALGDYDRSIQSHAVSNIKSEKLLMKIANECNSYYAQSTAIDKIKDEETIGDLVLSSKGDLTFSIKKLKSQSVLFRIFNETDNPNYKIACVEKIQYPKYLEKLQSIVDEKCKEIIDKKLSQFDLSKEYLMIGDIVIYESEAMKLRSIENIVGYKFKTFKYGIPDADDKIQSILNFHVKNYSVITLKIQNFSLKTIPDEIFALENLVHLDLSSNKIEEIPQSIVKLNKLNKLILTGNLITSLANLTSQSMVITELKVALNKISSIPDSIINLNLLKLFDLSHNEISYLPPGMKNLTNLEYLRIDNNLLAELGDYVNGLSNLKILNAKNNKIQILPNFNSSTSSVKSLLLCNNKIKSIPDTITNLHNLNSLNLCNNKIKRLPENIDKCKNLEYLYIPNNLLSELPIRISNFNNLKNLEIKLNPLHPALQFSSFDYWVPRDEFGQNNDMKEENLIKHKHKPIYLNNTYLKQFFHRIENYRERLSKNKWISNDELSYYSKFDYFMTPGEHYCDQGCSDKFESIDNQEDLYKFLKKHNETIYEGVGGNHKVLDLLVDELYIIELMKLGRISRWQVYNKVQTQEFLKRLLFLEFDDYPEMYDLNMLLNIYQRIENPDNSIKFNLIWMIIDNFDGDQGSAIETKDSQWDAISSIIQSITDVNILKKLLYIVWQQHFVKIILETIKIQMNNSLTTFFDDLIREGILVEYLWLDYIESIQQLQEILRSNFDEKSVFDSYGLFPKLHMMAQSFYRLKEKFNLNSEFMRNLGLTTRYKLIVFTLLHMVGEESIRNRIINNRPDINITDYLGYRFWDIPLKQGFEIPKTLILEKYKENQMHEIPTLIENIIKSKAIKYGEEWESDLEKFFTPKHLFMILFQKRQITSMLNGETIQSIEEILKSLSELLDLNEYDFLHLIPTYRIEDKMVQATINIIERPDVLRQIAQLEISENMINSINDKLRTLTFQTNLDDYF